MWLLGLLVHDFIRSESTDLVNLKMGRTVVSISSYMAKKCSSGIDGHVNGNTILRSRKSDLWQAKISDKYVSIST